MARTITDIGDPRLVKALAHPLRVDILRALAERVASPSELAQELGVPLPNLSYHFRMLVQLELLELVRTRPRRGAIEHYYRTIPGIEVSDSTWSQLPAAVADQVVGVAIRGIAEDAMGAASVGGIKQLQSEEVELDEAGWKAVAQSCERFRKEVAKAVASSERRGDGRRKGAVAILAFERRERGLRADVLRLVGELDHPTLGSITRELHPDDGRSIGRKHPPGKPIALMLDQLVEEGKIEVLGAYRRGTEYGLTDSNR